MKTVTKIFLIIFILTFTFQLVSCKDNTGTSGGDITNQNPPVDSVTENPDPSTQETPNTPSESNPDKNETSDKNETGNKDETENKNENNDKNETGSQPPENDLSNETLVPSEGFKFSLNGKGSAYSISNYTGSDTEVVIPSEYNGLKVEVIGENCFRECSHITSVYIPNTIKTIGDWAFYSCKNLTKISMPNSVQLLGVSVFSKCSNLSEVKLSKNLKAISSYAFYNCESLTEIIIPSKIINIGSYAFSNSGLNEIEIPDNVTEISENAFTNCSNLEKIKFGAGLSDLGQFYSCNALKEITVDEDNKTYYEKNNCVIKIENNELILGCGTDIIIPDGVKSISYNAFKSFSVLKSITIPNSVALIGNYAFYQCKNLKDIYYNGTTSEWNSVNKILDWDWNTGKDGYTVHCSDGDIVK